MCLFKTLAFRLKIMTQQPINIVFADVTFFKMSLYFSQSSNNINHSWISNCPYSSNSASPSTSTLSLLPSPSSSYSHQWCFSYDTGPFALLDGPLIPPSPQKSIYSSPNPHSIYNSLSYYRLSRSYPTFISSSSIVPIYKPIIPLFLFLRL